MISVSVQNTASREVKDEPRRTFGQRAGLAIVKNEMERFPYSVTHVASGLSVGHFHKLAKARQFMDAIADVADWFKGAKALKADAKRICPILRGIYNETR